jgi:RNA polymerase subunit RPABC4/transcription elongation factor Spt4
MEHIIACPKCGGANRSGQLLCRFCGQSLAHKCSRCQVDIEPATGKCPYCGESLTAWSIGQPETGEKPAEKIDPVPV